MCIDNKSNIYIEYNPYTVKTKIEIDGKSISNESSLKKCNNKRLQYWLEKNRNWQGIIEELKRSVNNAEGINITFKGRKIDFDDLKLTVDKYNANNNIILDFIQGKEDNDVLKNIDKLFKEIQDGPIEELKTEELKKTYEEVKSSKFKISVLATMSSGKSTLINSLIGYELLPSKNMACTATVARITDNNKVNNFKVVCRDSNENIIYDEKVILLKDIEKYNDDEKVILLKDIEKYNDDEKVISLKDIEKYNDDEKVISLKDIEKYNDDEKVTYIDIEGNIPGISSDKLNLLLYDTPGPNNSRNERHGELTKGVIEDKKKGVVLYVLNATQFGINDDANLLEDISFQMKEGGKQSKDRFIFVINKCDELEIEKGESVDDLLEGVRKYLKKYDIEDPNLFPVTAQGAKLIRMYKNGTSFTRKERKELDGIVEDFNDLDGYHFEKKCTLSESCKENIDRKLRYAIENNDKYEEALIHTGIPCIEEVINEYLEKYAYPIKIKDAIKEIEEIVCEKNMLLNFKESIAKDGKKYNEVVNRLRIAKSNLKKMNYAESTKNRINKINIDEKSIKEMENELLRYINDIAEKYYGKEEIEKNKADEMQLDFMKKIMELEKYWNKSVYKYIEENIINKGEKLVNEYNNCLNKISEELMIENFSFKDMVGNKEIEFDDIFEENFKSNIKYEDIYKEEWRRNTTKRWWKPWTWKEDKFYTAKIKIGQKGFVNFQQYISDVVADVIKILKDNMKEIKKNFEEDLEKNKKILIDKIDKLEKKKNDTSQLLERMLKNQDEIKKELDENKKKNKNMQDIKFKIDNIMNM